MYIKAITGDGFFRIFENVKKVRMLQKHSRIDFKDSEVKSMTLKEFIKDYDYVRNQELTFVGLDGTHAEMIILNKNKDKESCSAGDQTRHYNCTIFQEKEKDADTFLISESRVYLCNDSGKTIESI